MERECILEFYQEFFNKQNLSYAEKLISENYIQHNPNVPQGRQGLINAFRKKFQSDEYFQIEIDRILIDLPYVSVFLRSLTDSGHTKAHVVDLYRVEDGLLVEHWDYFDKRRS